MSNVIIYKPYAKIDGRMIIQLLGDEKNKYISAHIDMNFFLLFQRQTITVRGNKRKTGSFGGNLMKCEQLKFYLL